MRKYFTPEEDDFLMKNKDIIPAKRMSKMLGRSECASRQRMKLIGAIPSREAVERFIKESHIKKGKVPPNKGVKLADYCSPEAIERMKKTQFHKGNLPHNTRSDFEISIRQDKKKQITSSSE